MVDVEDVGRAVEVAVRDGDCVSDLLERPHQRKERLAAVVAYDGFDLLVREKVVGLHVAILRGRDAFGFVELADAYVLRCQRQPAKVPVQILPTRCREGVRGASVRAVRAGARVTSVEVAGAPACPESKASRPPSTI
eukprot:1677018-Prymnesium_polylepis.2